MRRGSGAGKQGCDVKQERGTRVRLPVRAMAVVQCLDVAILTKMACTVRDGYGAGIGSMFANARAKWTGSEGRVRVCFGSVGRG